MVKMCCLFINKQEIFVQALQEIVSDVILSDLNRTYRKMHLISSFLKHKTLINTTNAVHFVK